MASECKETAKQSGGLSLEVGKSYKGRDGRKYTCIGTQDYFRYPMLVGCDDEIGGITYSYPPNGKYSPNGSDSYLDLLEEIPALSSESLVYGNDALSDKVFVTEHYSKQLHIQFPSLDSCSHSWVDTGMRKSWCKHCNVDRPAE